MWVCQNKLGFIWACAPVNGHKGHIMLKSIEYYETGTTVKYQGEKYQVLQSTIDVNGIGGIVQTVEIGQMDEYGDFVDGSDKSVPFGHLSLY